MDLHELRTQIDKIDEELVHLFQQRMDISKKVAQYKKKHSIPIHDPKRELEVLSKMVKKVKKERESAIKALYMLLFELSRSEQENI